MSSMVFPFQEYANKKNVPEVKYWANAKAYNFPESFSKDFLAKT